MNFHHPIIKDLAWLIKSPGLLKPTNALIPDQHWFNEQFDNIYPVLVELDAQADVLYSFKSQIKPIVGDYFEKLVALWLKNNSNIHLIKQHQLVFECLQPGKRTVGEFDFLFIDRSALETSCHWEVAVKFYLQFNNGKDTVFLGPNAQDSLRKKTNKMLNQQLLLSQNPNAEEALVGYPKPIQALGILKGMLFYPSNLDWKNPTNFPPDVPPNHLKGWWSHALPLQIPQQVQNSRWLILKKPFWLTPHIEKQDILHKINDLKKFIATHFAQSERPLLLAEVMQTNTGEWIEISRGFIVSEHWPQVC